MDLEVASTHIDDAWLSKCYSDWLPKTWFIRAASCQDKTNRKWEIGTGFAVSPAGLVFTSAHVIRKAYTRGGPIDGRILQQGSKMYRATVLVYKPEWDIAILSFEMSKLCQYAKLAKDGSLFECQSLVHIGNGSGLIGSLCTCRVSHKCIGGVPLPECASTHHTADITRPYKVFGDIFSEDVHDEEDFRRYLHPRVPVIELSDGGFALESSGGPLFNLDGEIVGMFSMGACLRFGLHVDALRKVLKELSRKKFKHFVFPRGNYNLCKQFLRSKRKILMAPRPK